MELLSIQETFVPIQNHTFFSTTTHKEKNENGKRPAFFHQEGGSTFGWGVGRKRIFFNRDVPIVCVCGQCTSVKACNIPVRYYVTQKGVHKCSFPWWHRNATGYKSCPCWWWMMDWHLFLHSTHNNNQVVVVVEGLSSNMRAKLLLLLSLTSTGTGTSRPCSHNIFFGKAESSTVADASWFDKKPRKKESPWPFKVLEYWKTVRSI